MTSSRWSRLRDALRDPGRTDTLRRRLSGDREAGAALERMVTLIDGGSDPFDLRTGGGLPAAAWSNLLASLDSSALEPGDAIGRYVVLHHVASGGMGAVYAAYDPELDRKVGIKILHAVDPDDQARLLREARALARVDHPAIVAVHDVGTFEERVFLAMDLVDGVEMRRWSRERPWDEVLTAFLRAGEGLAAAHAAGLVHHDFKPENLLVRQDGHVCLVDFGLARKTLPGTGEWGNEPQSEAGPGTGPRVFGTPGYLPPEQVAGRGYDEQSDQFAFAVSLWESLYGRRPYPGSTFDEVAAAFVAPAPPLPPAASTVPVRIRRVLERSLAVDPAARFPDMRTMLNALSDRPYERWGRRAAWATPLLAAAGLSLWLAQREPGSICRGAADQLAGVWSADRAAAIQAAMTSGTDTNAEGTFARIRALLGGYAADWVEMRTSACEATHVLGEQSAPLLDLRMSCLDRRRSELEALVEALTSAGAEGADWGLDAALRLEPLVACADTRLLTASAPPPIDAESQARIAEIEDRLATAKAMRENDPATALMVANETVAAANALGYSPLTAEAWYLVGDLHEINGEYDASEASLFRAWQEAERGTHEEYVLRALNLLVWIDGNNRGRFDAAQRWAGLAGAVLERTDAGPLLRAEYYSNMGSALQMAGRIDEALDAHRRALGLRVQLFGDDSYEASKSLNNLAMVEYTAGRFGNALELFEQALAIIRRQLGIHPATAMTLGNVGSAALELGDAEAAMASFVETLDIRRQLFGDVHPWIGISVVNLGFASILGDPEQALVHFADSAAILAASLPADSPYHAYPMSGRGRALLALGRAREAIPELRRAIASWEATGGALPIDLAHNRFLLARALWEGAGDREEALALARVALEALAATPAEELPLRDEVAAWLGARPGA